MEVLGLLGLLWHRRRLMLVGLLVAIAAAVAVGGTKPASSGFARAQVLIDTPKSQLVDSAPAGADTLAWRAKLLAHLATAEPEKRQLAAAVGIRPDELAVVDPDLRVNGVAERAAELIRGRAVPAGTMSSRTSGRA